jgi:hypothetical protein
MGASSRALARPVQIQKAKARRQIEGLPLPGVGDGGGQACEGRPEGGLSKAVYVKYLGSCLWGPGLLSPVAGLAPGGRADPAPWQRLSGRDWAMGAGVALIGLLIFVLAQLLRIAADLSLVLWAQTASGGSENFPLFYRYCGTLGALLLLNLSRMLYLNTAAVAGSGRLHARILHSILAAPVPAFFDTVAMGEVDRILHYYYYYYYYFCYFYCTLHGVSCYYRHFYNLVHISSPSLPLSPSHVYICMYMHVLGAEPLRQGHGGVRHQHTRVPHAVPHQLDTGQPS